MKTNTLCKQLFKAFGYGAFSTSILLAAGGSHAAAQNEIAQVPPSVAEGVPPNMIFTLDESGSMSWSHIPDYSSDVYDKLIGSKGTSITNADSSTRRYRSANTNPIYYNPNVIYEIPPTFKADGSEYKLKTSFKEALVNGFHVSELGDNLGNGQGTTDLSKSYKIILEHRIPTGTLRESPHPAKDFTCIVDAPQNKEYTCKQGQIEYSVNKYSNTQCSASYIGYNGISSSANCSIVNNKAYINQAGSSSCSVRTDKKNDKYSCETGGSKYEIVRNSNTKCTATWISENGNIPVDCSVTGSGNRYTSTASSPIANVPAYYYDFDESLSSSCIDKKTDFDSGRGGENCYRLKWVGEDSAYDQQGNPLKHANGTLVNGEENFAIWYSFYRSRALATLSATKIAFYNLSPDVRFTWQDLDTCKTFESDSGNTCGNNKLKPYSAKHRGEFYTWLRKRYFNKSTPLPAAMKRAGEFLKTKAPWEKTPYAPTGNNKDNTYACRPSYHVMMTDGMWNATTGDPADFRSDHSTFTTPGGEKYGGKNYKENKPFYDNADNSTLADLAMHYWATDLNTSLDNKIRPYIPYKNDDSNKEYWDPRNNPAEWQSMSNFIMALGLTTSLGTGSNSNLPWAGTTHGGEGYAKLLQGTSWPEASSGSDNNVYDLWHAAINSRGEFYSVDSPEAMVQAFQDILTRIAERKSSAAMPGTSSAIEVFEDADGNKDGRLHQFFYQTTFNSADGWSGDLTKTERYREYNETTKEFEWVTKNAWSAAAKLPAHGARKIYMANSTGNNLIEFTAANSANSATYNGKTLDQHLAVNPEPGKQSNAYTAAQRLDYLRGSDASAGEADDKMRERSSKLGDFLGSSPVVVGNQGRYLEGFSNKLEENEAYTAFLASIQNRKAMVYVGGNAGMLHAFNAETGVEEFAFVPTAVFPYLNKLTGKGYTHQYYVDGTPTVADIYDKEKGKWRTILVGTLRAGGKGLFALDITDPEKISLLWEFHEYSAEAVDLAIKPGYSFPKPTVARLHNGSWAVVTGNGYKGEGTNNGGAALYIIDAITGKLTKSLEVTGETGENGLSTPRLVDFDGDGVADYAYAGDLQGNLWRFDLLGGSATGPDTNHPNGSYGTKSDGISKFQVSYNGSPMFKARSENGQIQPITSAPSVIRHPTRLGYLVVFGTGRYVEIGDKEPNKSYAQSLYGIWDEKTKGEDTNNPPSITRDNMTEQTFNKTDTTGKGETSGIVRNARIISNNPVEWYTDFNSAKDIKKRGWYLDFNGGGNQGEIMVEDMRTLGNTLFLQTLIPNDDPCANGAGNWLYAINPSTGGRTLHHAFDTRGANDLILSGIQFGTEGGVSIGQDEEGYKAFAPGDLEPISPDPSSLGRQSWRMIQNP